MNNHGGPRPGAGRKPGQDPNAAHRVRRMIMLSEEEYRQAKMIGDGNISAGVRRAIAALTGASAPPSDKPSS